MWVTSVKTHCLVFFVCLFWKVGCVSTGVVTVFVFFPSVLPVIRTVLILFLQLTRGSLKRINQYPLLIPHTAASYLKPCPCYFFLLYPFFQELTQNYDASTRSNVLSAVVSQFLYVRVPFFFFLFFLFPIFFPSLSLPRVDSFSGETWMNFVSFPQYPNPSAIFFFSWFFFFFLLLILPSRVLMLEWLLTCHFCCLTSILPLVQVLEKELHCHRFELQVNDLKQHIKQMVKLTNLQDQENKRMQKQVGPE